MAVYKHHYRPYSGELTPRWRRWLVLPRYAYRTVFQSRFFLVFYVICFVVPAGAAVLIYLKHNLGALEMLQLPAAELVPIDGRFFRWLLQFQGGLVFLLTVFVGPGLVSPDLTNNGMALYLSRPFSRVDYIAGKLAVLLILQSTVSWLPLSVLFFLQASLAGTGWMTENRWILPAVFAGSLIWMLVLSFLALALSAWVRWKAVAGALMFGVFFVSQGFGATLNEILVTRWGGLLQLNHLIRVVWLSLFGEAQDVGRGFHGVVVGEIPVWSAWLALGMVCLVCLGLLSRRIRAYEVVR
jgi:ABC-2 type transport system permease protein